VALRVLLPTKGAKTMLQLHNILMATDFSPASDYAFALACALARDHGARLLLLHVREQPVVPVGEYGVPPALGEEDDDVRQRLLALQPSDKSVEVEYLVAEGEAAPDIVDVARQRACDLIVLGSHGRTGLVHVLMGSVAESVMRRADCPVLVVKQPLPSGAGVGAAAETTAAEGSA
jgi:nucleotide-binding universal stress UspA family protein